jgi:hypothetical protein
MVLVPRDSLAGAERIGVSRPDPPSPPYGAHTLRRAEPPGQMAWVLPPR